MGTPAWLSDAQAALDETKAPPQTVPLQMVASRLTKAQEEQFEILTKLGDRKSVV